ncbi:G-PROTEIN-RECEP-F1-2 domain-containing protein [Aphelenchoides bicaudatus]|nr:G-PROTEIN-RECEP-F1-2 domain-containing protein [Aphelenchoides bicaudatus]
MNSTQEKSFDPFFERYKDHDFIWPFLPGVILFIPVILTGTIGNISVFVVTIRTKTLRNICNYLLAISCVCDVAHASSLYLTLFIIITRTNFIPLRICFFSQLIPQIGLNVGLALTMMIGIDRLISVIFPLRHRNFNTAIYLSVLLTFCIAYAFKIISKGYFNMLKNPDELVSCTIVDALPGDADVNEATKRIFKSLSVIMLFLLFGWLFNAAMRTVFIIVDANLLTVNYAGLYGGLLVNITIASNGLILYLFSQDYRCALKQEINLFSRRITGKSVMYMTNVEDLQSGMQQRPSIITIKDI